MIRFVDLGKQLGIDETWPREFCFYDTMPGTFIDLGGSGCQVWHSWKDFEEDCIAEKAPQDFIDRLRGLCPEWVFTAVPQ